VRGGPWQENYFWLSSLPELFRFSSRAVSVRFGSQIFAARCDFVMSLALCLYAVVSSTRRMRFLIRRRFVCQFSMGPRTRDNIGSFENEVETKETEMGHIPKDCWQTLPS
jgi:hypothetical protein